MWEALYRKFWPLLQSFESGAVTYPGQCAVYFSLTALLIGLFCTWFYGRRFKRAFWCLIGFIVICSAFYHGDDTKDHVYRILVLSEQIRQGQFGLLFPNWTTGDVYPVFVYYSFLPYILPTALNLAGLPAAVSFKIAMDVQLIVFAAGLQALIESRPCEDADNNRRADFLLAILFMSATYVYGLWLIRAAFGELWAFSLAPWVVRFSFSPRTTRSLIAALFLQVCAHPLVFLQCIAGELIVALGLSQQSPLTTIRRVFVASSIAIALATPFWLPQFIWLHDILGNAALPIAFSDTFLSLREMLDPRYLRNIGLWIPCAIAIVIVASRGRLPSRAWLMIATFIALAALQTIYLRAIAVHVPILNQSQFVWRLMMATAFVAFGALLVGWKATGSLQWSLAALVVASVAWMVASQWLQAPGNIAYQSSVKYETSGWTDADGHFDYTDPANVWGMGLFAADYSRLQQNCDVVDNHQARNLSFTELRSGVHADTRFIYVREAPIGFVRYLSGGIEVPQSACHDGLVLGPLQVGDRVQTSERTLHALFEVRVLDLVAALVIILVPVRMSRRTPAPLPGH
jgi:hypothetical protein